jgi:hypothetical protein
MYVVDVAATMTEGGGARLRSGDPEESAILRRMRAAPEPAESIERAGKALRVGRVPRIGGGGVDEKGVALVSEWARSLRPGGLSLTGAETPAAPPVRQPVED